MNDCYDENTFKLNETIFNAFHHMYKQNDVLQNSSNWNVNKGSVFMGQCHTFQYPDPLQADMVTDGLLFAINPNISYRVFFHDPKYYLLVSNPMVFPRIWFEYEVMIKYITFKTYKYLSLQNKEPNTFVWYYISVTEHQLYNRPERQCEVFDVFEVKLKLTFFI